jgi:hypothetical protein
MKSPVQEILRKCECRRLQLSTVQYECDYFTEEEGFCQDLGALAFAGLR